MRMATPAKAPRPAGDCRRFQGAMAALWETGVVALGPLGAEPEGAHAIMREQLSRRFPGGMGSYLFWTRQDGRAFAADGSLRAPLTLHCSGAEVAETAVALLGEQGLDAEVAPGGITVSVCPAALATEDR